MINLLATISLTLVIIPAFIGVLFLIYDIFKNRVSDNMHWVGVTAATSLLSGVLLMLITVLFEIWSRVL